ncbi:hypothetical protein H6G04_16705 [Calothrix membranacea FACHB-236]|nr:hypothetical protein [Calothrix membranacea FACHB-236]
MTQAETPQYDLSRVCALFTSNRELYETLQVLKRIGQAIAPSLGTRK